MDVLVGTAAAVSFLLAGPTGALPPDNSEVTYSIFGQSGALVSGPTDLPITAGTSTVSIPVGTGLTTITGGRRYEKRTVRISWTSGGQAYNDRQTLRVIPFLNITVSEENVRALLGLNEDELENEGIDIFASYLAVEEQVTQTVLDDALSSGTLVESQANALIAVDAALAVLPSARTRILMAQSDGVMKAERFRTVPDLDKLSADLTAQRAALLATVTGVASTVPVRISLSVPTDVITGV